jgi:hypothetical protein
MKEQLEKSGLDLTEVLSWHFPGETDEKQRKHDVPAENRNENILNTSQEGYR